MAPAWILFDLNGTLLDPATIDRALGAAGEGVGGAALDDAVKHAMALTLAGGYRPFAEILEAALARALALAGGNERRLGDAVAAAARLEPFGEVRDAIGTLRELGPRLAVLTNSAAETAVANLTAIGLLEAFDRVVGTDEVLAFKPAGRVYRHALDRLGASPDDVCFVSAHGWDVGGAASAGLTTAWISRRERILMRTVPGPEVVGEDLDAVVRTLHARG